MNSSLNEKLSQLLHSLELKEIKPMALNSASLGIIPDKGNELQLEWKQSIADGDPLAPVPDTRIFRPKYEFTIKFQGSMIFMQESKFLLVFRVLNTNIFNELWADEELRKIFIEKQLQRTMWPLFRQHVQDGMCRLGMAPVALPWLL
jgi:hypothetical protein